MAINQSQLNKSRLDKFLCVINLPSALRTINDNDAGSIDKDKVNENALQFSVYGAVVPDITVPDEILGYAGQSYKVSTHSRPPYANVTIDFAVDSKFNNYWTIYKWLDLLNDDRESVYTGGDDPGPASNHKPPNAYQAIITIYGLDEFDKEIVKFTYTNAFPVTLGGINYNYRETSEVETSFEFAFSQLIVDLI